MIKINDKAKCCGCTACYSVCPKGCISMTSDEEGFLYPVVNIDLCITCDLCEKVCPIINQPELPMKSRTAFVVQTQDERVLKGSTSGGFSDTLYRYILCGGGYIAGCIYDKDWMPYHVIAHDSGILLELRGSKYAQSRLGDTFSEVKKLLTNDKTVCFVGTPCQVAGLKGYLRKDCENLVTVDLVCRSIPSPLMLKGYLDWQQKRFSSKVKYLNCRNKTYGYHHGSLVIGFENGKRYSGSNRVDPYMKAFHSNICSRPACYECVFKTATRCSDFTVFDCWQPESLSKKIKDNNKGYSNVIIHTDKGLKVFENLLGIDKWETTPEKMFQFTGGMESKAINKPKQRDGFYRDLVSNGFEESVYSSINVTAKDRVIESTKQILYRTGLLNIIWNVKHNRRIQK